MVDEPYAENARTEPHSHIDEKGAIVKCYHTCKAELIRPGFWFAFTLGFPIEHAIWTFLPPFKYIAAWLGLTDGH